MAAAAAKTPLNLNEDSTGAPWGKDPKHPERDAKVSRMGTASIPMLITEFAIPAILGMLVNGAYNVIDSIFLGQAMGEIGLSAATVANPIMIVFMALAMLVGNGGNALAALRTVAPASVMYSPNCTARSSGLPFMPQQLPICVCCIYMAASGGLCGQSEEKGRRTVKCEPSAAAAAACHKRPKCNVQPRWYGFWNFKQNMQCFFWKRTKPVLFFIDKKTMIITKHKHRLLPSLLFGKGAPI